MLKRIVATALAVAFALTFATGVAVAAAKPAPAGKVNINTATAEQLTTLPGVGPKLAVRIVEYRQKAGSFKSVQELPSGFSKAIHGWTSSRRGMYSRTPPGFRTGATTSSRWRSSSRRARSVNTRVKASTICSPWWRR